MIYWCFIKHGPLSLLSHSTIVSHWQQQLHPLQCKSVQQCQPFDHHKDGPICWVFNIARPSGTPQMTRPPTSSPQSSMDYVQIQHELAQEVQNQLYPLLVLRKGGWVPALSEPSHGSTNNFMTRFFDTTSKYCNVDQTGGAVPRPIIWLWLHSFYCPLEDFHLCTFNMCIPQGSATFSPCYMGDAMWQILMVDGPCNVVQCIVQPMDHGRWEHRTTPSPMGN